MNNRDLHDRKTPAPRITTQARRRTQIDGQLVPILVGDMMRYALCLSNMILGFVDVALRRRQQLALILPIFW